LQLALRCAFEICGANADFIELRKKIDNEERYQNLLDFWKTGLRRLEGKKGNIPIGMIHVANEIYAASPSAYRRVTYHFLESQTLLQFSQIANKMACIYHVVVFTKNDLCTQKVRIL
jgi:hypothetical protein